MHNSLKKEQFIAQAKEIHGNKYDYSKTVYVNTCTPVSIICPIHGEFKKRPAEHIKRRSGCPKCGKVAKHTKESFIEKAVEIHGHHYKYDKVVFINGNTPVSIGCPVHGYYYQLPKMHLHGHGCPKCARNVRYDTEAFIKKATEIHSDKYDYTKTDYKNYSTKVTITCKIHGDFVQTAGLHLSGSGCPKCAIEKSRLTQEEFIERGRKLFDNKYDYSLVEYKNLKTKVKIICPVHGVFEQQPSCHLQGWGCVKCGNERQLHTLEHFIARAREVHGNKYSYANAHYIGSYKPITITCPKHGDFTQRASAHIEGEGCPACKHSQGEHKIAMYLDKTGVKYIREYKFADCKDKSKLKFDFALFNNDGSLRCLIEFQGEQHYRFIKCIHKDIARYKSSLKRDKIKRKYCKKNDITLIEVSYKQDLQEFFEEAGGLLWK